MSNHSHFVGVVRTPAAPADPYELPRLRDENRLLQQRLQVLERKAYGYATVIEVHTTHIQLQIAGGPLCDADVPPHLQVEPGDLVRITDTAQVLSKHPRELSMGAIVTVEAVKPPMLEVDFASARKLVRSVVEAKPRDRVLLDGSNVIAVRNLGPAETPLVFTGDVAVSWEEIGGLAEAKRALREAIEEPVLHAETYRRHGRRPTRGILLHGPSGCGKTLIAKAAATANARVHNADVSASGFIYVRGPEILNRWAGNSEENIRRLFVSARTHKERHGYPAIVFIDEADAIMRKRGRDVVEGMERTLVPQFLAEMDGLEETGAIVILATNRPDILDPAVVRDGRVDRKIYIPRPTEDEARAIVVACLAGRPLDDGADAEALAKETVERVFLPTNALVMIKCRDADHQRLNLSHIVSGAMLAGLVDNASQLAIRRELDTGTPSGVSLEDVRAAVQQVLRENRAINHDEAVIDLVGDRTKILAVDAVRSK